MPKSLDSFDCRRTLQANGTTYTYFSLVEAENNGLAGVSRLPFSLKVLLENLLRFEDGRTVTADDIRALADWVRDKRSDREIAYRPARVLMQDFTGVPAVVDLAAMRDATAHLGGDPRLVNPQVPVDLVIDHSVMVDYFGVPTAFERNVEREYERNGENATPFCAGARRPFPTSASCRRAPASAIRSTWNISPRRSGPARRARRAPRSPMPIPIPWSAPIPTPPWSMACRCWAGASAASRPRPPCSASPFPC